MDDIENIKHSFFHRYQHWGVCCPCLLVYLKNHIVTDCILNSVRNVRSYHFQGMAAHSATTLCTMAALGMVMAMLLFVGSTAAEQFNETAAYQTCTTTPASCTHLWVGLIFVDELVHMQTIANTPHDLLHAMVSWLLSTCMSQWFLQGSSNMNSSHCVWMLICPLCVRSLF